MATANHLTIPRQAIFSTQPTNSTASCFAIAPAATPNHFTIATTWSCEISYPMATVCHLTIPRQAILSNHLITTKANRLAIAPVTTTMRTGMNLAYMILHLLSRRESTRVTALRAPKLLNVKFTCRLVPDKCELFQVVLFYFLFVIIGGRYASRIIKSQEWLRTKYAYHVLMSTNEEGNDTRITRKDFWWRPTLTFSYRYTHNCRRGSYATLFPACMCCMRCMCCMCCMCCMSQTHVITRYLRSRFFSCWLTYCIIYSILFERSEFLIDTSQKKSPRVCTCARVK